MHTRRSRAGYANSDRAPRACWITEPHIAIAPITATPFEKTRADASDFTESAA